MLPPRNQAKVFISAPAQPARNFFRDGTRSRCNSIRQTFVDQGRFHAK
jgi:hypothetical protein